MAEQQTRSIGEQCDEATKALLDRRDSTTFCCDKLHDRLDTMDGRLGRIEPVLSEVLNEVTALSSRHTP